MEQWKLYGAIYADSEPPPGVSARGVGTSATAEETLKEHPRTPEKSQRSQTISIMDFNRLQPGAAIASPGLPSQRRLFKENKIVFSEIIRDADKDWNREFQTYLEMRDSEERHRKIFELAHDFVYVATMYAKCIISEYSLPDEEKSIRPIVAYGRQKYFNQGVLFKLASDFPIPDGKGQTIWMFGGTAPSDEAAMKSCSNELRALMNYYYASIAGLSFPLVAIIDYLGFRVLASTILPISSSTLAYGSCDSGVKVHADDEVLNEKMERAAEYLNLRKHLTGLVETKELCSCGDMEAHKGTDKRYYVVDFARAFPPEAPLRVPAQTSSKESRQVYFKQLRPEWVRGYTVDGSKTPLSPDAFSGWDNADPQKHMWREEVRQATQALVQRACQNFAAELDKEDSQSESVQKDIFFEKLRITERAHRLGINCRHLERVRRFSIRERVRELLLLEMTCRAIKNLLRRRFREKMKELKVLSEEPFKHLNFILKRGGFQAFWLEVFAALQEHFSINPSELSLEYNYDLRLFFRRLMAMTGLTLTPQALSELLDEPHSFEFVESDAEELRVSVRHMNIVDFHEGMALSSAARGKAPHERLRLLQLASIKFHNSVMVMPHNAPVVFEWGRTLAAQADLVPMLDSIRLLDKACEKLEAAAAIDPRFAKCHLQLGHTLFERARRLHPGDAKSLDRLLAQLTHAYTQALQLAPDDKSRTEMQLKAEWVYDAVRTKPDVELLRGVFAACKVLLAERRGASADAALLLWGRALLKYARYRMRGELVDLSGPQLLMENSTGATFAGIAEEAAEKFRLALEAQPAQLDLVLGLAREEAARGTRGNKKMYFVAACIYRVLSMFVTSASAELLLEYGRCLWQCAHIGNFMCGEATFLVRAANVFEKVLAQAPDAFDGLVEEAATFNQRKDLLNLAALCMTPDTPLLHATFERACTALTSLDLQGCLAPPEAFEALAKCCPNVISVNFADCPLLSDHVVRRFAQHRSLTSCDFSGCQGVRPAAVLDLLSRSTRLEQLSLKHCEVNDECVRELAAHTTLRVLDLSGYRLRPAHFPLLGKLRLMERLYLNNCYIDSDRAVVAMLSGMRELYAISLKESKIGDPTVHELAKLSKLQDICLARCPLISDEAICGLDALPHLNTLDLSENFHIVNLTRLRLLTSLTTLSLKECKKVSLTSVSGFLLSSPHLKHLELPGEGVSRGGERLVGTLPARLGLTRLVLNRSRAVTGDMIAAVVSAAMDLTVIELGGVGKAVTEQVVSALASLAELSSLTLSDAAASSTSLLALTRLSTLRLLSLANCEVTDDVLGALLIACTNLYSLDISRCAKVSEVGLRGLPLLPALRELNLARNVESVSDPLLIHLAACPSLERLDVTFCTMLTDLSVTRFAKQVAAPVHTLLLGRCSQITSRGVLSVLQYLPVEVLEVWAMPLLTDEILVYIMQHELSLKRLGAEHCPELNEKTLQALEKLKPHIEVKHGMALMTDLQRSIMQRFASEKNVAAAANRAGP